MGSDAWNEHAGGRRAGPRPDRVWWAAYAMDPKMQLSAEAPLMGYAGGWVVDGRAADPQGGRRSRRSAAAASRASCSPAWPADARNLGAAHVLARGACRQTSVRRRCTRRSASTRWARRPRYYSDGEDALIMEGPLPTIAPAATWPACSCRWLTRGPAAFRGRRARPGISAATWLASEPARPAVARPLILAIESSCDETAAAIVDGEGNLVRSDIVATRRWISTRASAAWCPR